MNGHPHCLALVVAAPAFLYAGAAAAALPVLIHLWNRRRYRRVRWAAMEFLLAAERSGRKRIEVRDWLLVGLRSLAMLCIGLLVAGVRCDSSAAARPAMQHLVLLDDSVSMGAIRQGGGTVWQQAIEQVAGLAERVAADSPGSSLRVVRASRPEVAVFDAQPLRSTDPARLAELLRSDPPSFRAGVLGPAIRQLQPNIGMLHIISDLQHSDWEAIDPAAVQRVAPASVEVIDAGPADQANLAAGPFSFERPRPVTRVPVRLHVRTHNYGLGPRSPGPLRARVGQAVLPPVEAADLPAGQSAGVPLTLSFEGSGPQPAAVEIAPDSLLVDNTFYQVVPVAEAVRVAVVDERDDGLLLSVALRPEGRQSSGIEVTRLSPAGLETMPDERFDVVCVCNLARPSAAAVAALEAHAASGGGVLFFVGDQVEAAAWNQAFYRDGAGPLPAPLAELRDGAAEGSRIVVGEDARLLPGIAAAPPVLLGGPSVQRWYALGPQSGDRRASTLLKLEGGDPLIVARGRAALMVTSVDKRWTDLPDHPLYVALCIELVQTLSRPAAWAPAAHVGEPLTIDLGPEAAGRRVALHRPSYPRTPPVELTADARGRVAFADPSEPGVYWFDPPQADVASPRQGRAVNLDPAESDLRPVPAGELARRLDISVSGTVGAQVQAPPRPWWPWVLAGLVGLLAAEQLLAWRFGRAGGKAGGALA